MVVRNAASRRKESLYFFRYDWTVGDLVYFHLVDFNITNIEPPASPGNHIIKTTAFYCIIFGQDIFSFYSSRFTYSYLIGRSDDFTPTHLPFTEFPHRLNHLYSLS